MVAPVAGFTTGSVAPEAAGTHEPAMKFLFGMTHSWLGRTTAGGPGRDATMLRRAGGHRKGFRRGRGFRGRYPRRKAPESLRCATESVRLRPTWSGGGGGRPNVAVSESVGNTDTVIGIEHVTKRFGSFVAVDDADFGIRR